MALSNDDEISDLVFTVARRERTTESAIGVEMAARVRAYLKERT